jgi:hypothetical protein
MHQGHDTVVSMKHATTYTELPDQLRQPDREEQRLHGHASPLHCTPHELLPSADGQCHADCHWHATWTVVTNAAYPSPAATGTQVAMSKIYSHTSYPPSSVKGMSNAYSWKCTASQAEIRRHHQNQPGMQHSGQKRKDAAPYTQLPGQLCGSG